MASKQIRVSDRLYARVKSETREGETMGEALERMTNDFSLLDVVSENPEYDAESAEAQKRAVERSKERGREETRELTERVDS